MGWGERLSEGVAGGEGHWCCAPLWVAREDALGVVVGEGRGAGWGEEEGRWWWHRCRVLRRHRRRIVRSIAGSMVGGEGWKDGWAKVGVDLA